MMKSDHTSTENIITTPDFSTTSRVSAPFNTGGGINIIDF